ncbi:MAG: STAS domain-containing protein [Phycisphaerales bacterium]
MAKVASRLRVQDVGGVTRVEFVDKNILDEANIQQIGEELVKLADAGPRPRLLLCFKGVDHLSSAALGVLINVHNRVKAKDGQLRLSDINAQIFEVFKITKLNKLFQVFDTAEQAMKSFT